MANIFLISQLQEKEASNTNSHLKSVECLALHARSKKNQATFMGVNIPTHIQLLCLHQLQWFWLRIICIQV